MPIKPWHFCLQTHRRHTAGQHQQCCSKGCSAIRRNRSIGAVTVLCLSQRKQQQAVPSRCVLPAQLNGQCFNVALALAHISSAMLS